MEEIVMNALETKNMYKTHSYCEKNAAREQKELMNTKKFIHPIVHTSVVKQTNSMVS